jgi:predicted TIM-barrel fold metal-dependent hydrolase
VFHDFPALKVVLAESGIGWMPWLVERAETAWDRHRWYSGVDVATNPRDLFDRNIFGCFISDEFGVRHRDEIGLQRIMWEGDYPHSDSNWPNSRTKLEKTLAEVPDDEARAVAELNARQIFCFPDE